MLKRFVKKDTEIIFARLLSGLLVGLFFVLYLPSSSYAEKLNAGYLEFPPYCYTAENGTANGTLILLAARIFNKAGVEFRYQRLPARRILLNIKHFDNFASVGWFKNPEREEFATFSLPIYKNKPIGLLVRFKDRYKFSRYSTMESLLANTNFKIGHIHGHSAGVYLEPLLQKYPGNVAKISGTKLQMVKMLIAERVDAIILAPEELPVLVQKSGFSKKEFAHVSFKDIPEGNKRYLIFSKSVAPETISRINKAILEIVGDLNKGEHGNKTAAD